MKLKTCIEPQAYEATSNMVLTSGTFHT